MKTPTLIISIICLGISPALAEEKDPLEDLADRTNMIKAEEYLEMTKPVKDYAHRTAKKLTPQEIQLMSSAQNRINKNVARKTGAKEPQPVDLTKKTTKELEDFLTPPMYTYDDIKINK